MNIFTIGLKYLGYSVLSLLVAVLTILKGVFCYAFMGLEKAIEAVQDVYEELTKWRPRKKCRHGA